MWEKIITLEAIAFIKVNSLDGETEIKTPRNLKNRLLGYKKNKENKIKYTDEIIVEFIKYLRENVDYKSVVLLAIPWIELPHDRQANLAIHHVGEHHASRFIMLMDYLSIKYQKGELN